MTRTTNAVKRLENDIPNPKLLPDMASITSLIAGTLTLSSTVCLAATLSHSSFLDSPMLWALAKIARLPGLREEIGTLSESKERSGISAENLIKNASIPYIESIDGLGSLSSDEFLASNHTLSQSAPCAFRSPLPADSESSLKIPETVQTSSFELAQSQLESIINNCYFEPGEWTQADEYFSRLWKEQSKASLDVLSAIVNTHLDDEHMLEGVMHILSSLPYSEIAPTGISIGIACGFNHSPLVIDRLIACFEDWGDPAAIQVLEGMDLSGMPWLSNYRDDVIRMLEKKKA